MIEKFFELKFIASQIGASICLDGDVCNGDGVEIKKLSSLESSGAGCLTFLDSSKLIDKFVLTKATACIVSEELKHHTPKGIYLLVVENPYVAYVKVASLFGPFSDNIETHHGSYYAAKTATIGKNVNIGHGCYIGENAVIGDDVTLYPNVFIGGHVIIGNGCIIYANASVMHAVMGNNVIIHSGARIGQDGFGYVPYQGKHVKIPHLGKVKIGNDVEIGANACIDRGTIDDTVIGDMSKIDNLVQLGHNVKLGRGCILVSQVGIAGSTKLGDYVSIGGQGGVAGHIELANYSQVAAKSGVLKSTKEYEIVMGYPAQPVKEFWKQVAKVRKLTEERK